MDNHSPIQKRPDSYQVQDIEQRWRSSWEKNQVYRWTTTSSTKREEQFSIDTPPPTVSGSLHLGHIFSYTQTDFIARFQRMQGKHVYYPMGWDDNGLPTERRVQNVYGIQCDLTKSYEKMEFVKTETLRPISRKNFIEHCEELTKEDEKVFKNLFQRLGLSVDWSLEYTTIQGDSQRISQASFLDLYNQKKVYGVESPTLWDITFQTAVAQAEVEDREVVGAYYDIQFEVEKSSDVFTISTTRPELLAACIAIVTHPDDQRYQHLVGKMAITPLFFGRVPILTSSHVDPEKGLGIMMICTFGDGQDVDWWKLNRYPLKQILTPEGRLQKIDFNGDHKSPFFSLDKKRAQEFYNELVHKFPNQAQKKIVELLQGQESSYSGQVVSLQGGPRPTKRMVKFYEKGERPLEYLTSRQWFIQLLPHKEDLLNIAEVIQWHPEHMKTRYTDWVRGLNQDWCISRQRFFGVPFPVWYPIDQEGRILHDRPIMAHKKSLPVDPIVDTPPGYQENQRDCPGGFTADKDVMDTWATSSLTPQIACRWDDEETSTTFNKLFPMDLRPQSHEIIRTWAFYTIVKSFFHSEHLEKDKQLAKRIPWKHVGVSGWILDPDRKKMSKSKGNVITPEKYLDDYGADSVRYWAARARLGVDTAFDENLFKMGRKLTNKLFNASKFVLTQIEQFQHYNPVFDNLLITESVDRAWVYRMNLLIDQATMAFEQLDYSLALQYIEETFWKFCDHYLEIIKVRSYQGNQEERQSCLSVLDWSLLTFLKLFAPFFPYLTEEIWSWIAKNNTSTVSSSLHKIRWPKNEAGVALNFHHYEEGKDLFLILENIMSEIRSAKTQQQKNLRWPVEKLFITTPSHFMSMIESAQKDIILAGNVLSFELREDAQLKAEFSAVTVEVFLSTENKDH